MIPSKLDPYSIEYLVDRFVDARAGVYRAVLNEATDCINRFGPFGMSPTDVVEEVVEELEQARMYGKAAGLDRIDFKTHVEKAVRKRMKR